MRGDSAVGHYGEAAAVENQTVIPADLIDIDDRACVMAREGAQHVDAEIALVDRVGRGGNIDDNFGALGDQFGYGVAFVERLGPEIFVIPDIFADRDSQLLPPSANVNCSLAGWK